MKAESTQGTESVTRKQLREKIAALSQSQLTSAAEALAMIWDGLIGHPGVPPTEPKSASSANYTQFSKHQSIIFPLSSNLYRVKLALLKSIPTGTFVDVQFYAYNALCGGLPTDPKPLFTSSIVIEEWAPAITTRKFKGPSYSALTYEKGTAGVDSKAAPLIDELADDYEFWHGDITETLHKENLVLYVPGLWDFSGGKVSRPA